MEPKRASQGPAERTSSAPGAVLGPAATRRLAYLSPVLFLLAYFALSRSMTSVGLSDVQSAAVLPSAIEPPASEAEEAAQNNVEIAPVQSEIYEPLPNNSSSRRGIFFVKTPKVGGTTLAVTLQRAALAWNMSIAVPISRMDKTTCSQTKEEAQKVWTKMLRRNPPEGLEIFASQVCLHTFMLKVGWRNGPPLLIGLVRDAWSRWLSAWRYLEKRCDAHDEELPLDMVALCKSRLPKGFEKYTDDLCGQSFMNSHLCSVQHAWLAPERGTSPAHLLALYDFVLVIEDFDTSLAVLHFDYGVPLKTLPYLVSNQDKSAPVPRCSQEVKSRALNRGLAMDNTLHRMAQAKLTQRARGLNKTTNGRFAKVVELLGRARIVAQEECSSDAAYNKDDCIVKSSKIVKQETCRHACLDAIWSKLESLGAPLN